METTQQPKDKAAPDEREERQGEQKPPPTQASELVSEDLPEPERVDRQNDLA
jgi:hypothetical protein